MVASRAIGEHRDTMVDQWLDWLGERATGTSTQSHELLYQELGLLVDVFGALVGPLRRDARAIWQRAAQGYGRHAAARGLAAGEVVEELQFFRELLIRNLAPAIAALRPRQSMGLLLRLNRLLDKGVAMAVVGYTDAIVATLLPSDGEDSPGRIDDTDSIRAELDQVREELSHLTSAEIG